MTTDRFSILTLPPKVFEKISKYLNLDELLDFSQCHEKFEELVTKSFVNNQDSSDVVFDVEFTARPSIYIGGHNWTTWKFYGKRSPKRVRYLELATKELTIRDSDSGSVKTLTFHVKRQKLIIGLHDSINDVILFAKHLAKLFDLSIRTLTIDAEHLDHLETLLSIEKIKKAKDVKIKCGTVSHEEMRRVLEGFEPESLAFHGGFERGFNFDGLLSQCYFRDAEKHTNTSRFELSLLQTINCHYPHSNPLTWNINEEVNHLLHLWCNGTDTRLKTLYFSITRHRHNDGEESQRYEHDAWKDEENFEFQKVVRGLERLLHPDEKHFISRHLNQFRRPGFPLRRIPVIQRETDGMMMSVDVKTVYMDTTCKLKPFFLWDIEDTLKLYGNTMRDVYKF